MLSYPACSLDGAQGRVVAPKSCFGLFEWDRQVLSYPACSLGGAQGVGGGAEIMFRGVRVGVGRCLLTLLVVSAGLKGGRWRRDHCSGSSSGGRQVLSYPACTLDGPEGWVVAPRLCFGLLEWG